MAGGRLGVRLAIVCEGFGRDHPRRRLRECAERARRDEEHAIASPPVASTRRRALPEAATF